MSHRHEAPGLPADWLNGWLAAIGATVLVPELRLAWTEEPVPIAVFETATNFDLAARIAGVLPTEESLTASTIARSVPASNDEFRRNITLSAFTERAHLERSNKTCELAASASDLRADADLTNLDHGAFDPPAPRGETLWSRALACARALESDADRPARVLDSLNGDASREQLNGLGFDARRLPVGFHASGAIAKVHADPVIELLCYAALALFPTRGDGRNIRQRGWRTRATQRGSFQWTAWRPFLDRWATDAFMDLPIAKNPAIIALYQVVPYQPAGAPDRTHAYFAERVANATRTWDNPH
jgi:hypothetical protein